MAIGPDGELDCTMRPLAQFRWFSMGIQRPNTLQQAWAPLYGGKVEWRDVPLVYAGQEITDTCPSPVAHTVSPPEQKDGDGVPALDPSAFFAASAEDAAAMVEALDGVNACDGGQR